MNYDPYRTVLAAIALERFAWYCFIGMLALWRDSAAVGTLLFWAYNYADGETAKTKAAVRRVLERALSSDYGKAGIALAAGSLLPVAAPYLGKAEAPINAAADELMAHGFEVAGVAAGEAVLDAVKPTLSILGGLVDSLANAGMGEDETEAPQLPASRRSGLDFEKLVADEVVEATSR